jgi:hypothetical protein
MPRLSVVPEMGPLVLRLAAQPISASIPASHVEPSIQLRPPNAARRTPLLSHL